MIVYISDILFWTTINLTVYKIMFYLFLFCGHLNLSFHEKPLTPPTPRQLHLECPMDRPIQRQRPKSLENQRKSQFLPRRKR